MNTKNDGGPVHPVRLPIDGALHKCDEPAPTELHIGMTLRDYFAGQALINMSFSEKPYFTLDTAAELAYHMADAMLKERAK